ncbi:cation-transporting P-type ATPase [Kineosporiaceae bacterium SCSIO 59966]|nr:cation-transporting P-type ATPase [Kineosporiaceae bacterium SCSIO 59966]
MGDGIDLQSGLSSTEAAARRARDGPNRMPAPRRTSMVRRFAGQLVHFFAVMLWAAGALAFAAGLPQLGVAIFLVIVVNAVFAFVQESRADRAAERLRELLPRRVTVRRDGRLQEIDAGEVVVGDVLALGPGDRVPADATVVVARNLLVDTSSLTGESEPSPVDEGTLYAGCFVVEGESDAVVTATGVSTRLAGIARLTVQTPSPPSPLARELHRVVRAIASIAVAVGGGFFVLALVLGDSASDGLVLAIGVTVALVPEALLPTVTLSLAWGAEQMAKREVLVRELEAVETLGSTTFICTDKTGTLTRNQMTVVEAWTPGGTAVIDTPGYEPTATVVLSNPGARHGLEVLALSAVRCSAGYVHPVDGGWAPHGDPMEAALDAFARRLGLDTDDDRTSHRPSVRFPFDPRRRRMSIVIDDEVLVKGAPDTVLPLCSDVEGAAQALTALTDKGLRVLAVAGKATAGSAPSSAEDAEAGLSLMGLVAMEDPPRPDVAEAIETCRRARIKVAMITGDHPATAAAIATQVGLRRPDDPVLSGDELPADDQVLGALLDRDGLVVARVSPEDKLRIARSLRARGHVVAMTGDGVNDGPALHEADIGIAMGASGTDVAREAADLVLLDDHFATIVAGIEQGRTTFVNVRRFLTYHLTDNVAELVPFLVWALSGGHFPLALGVLQILALDLGTDTLSAVALGAEPPARGVLEQPPVSGPLLNRAVARRAFGVLGPTEAAMSMTAFVVSFAAAGWRPGEPFPGGATAAAASGAAFMTVVLAQTANAFACRSFIHWPGALGWTTNRLLPPAICLGLAFSLLVLFVEPIANELGHAVPPLAGWVIAVLSVGAVLAADAIDKRRHHHRR